MLFVVSENGEYAFLAESSSIEYYVQRQCELMQVGGLLDNKGYGIALPPGKKITEWRVNIGSQNFCFSDSPYTSSISSAILQLQENRKLLILKERWWKQRRGGGKCKVIFLHFPKNHTILPKAVKISFVFLQTDDKKGSGSANELGLANVGGVFVVLLGGIGIACLIAVCEFIWKSRKLAIDEKVCSRRLRGFLSGYFAYFLCFEQDSLFSEMAKELRFAVQCKHSTKPVRKKEFTGSGPSVTGDALLRSLFRDDSQSQYTDRRAMASNP